MSQITTYFPMYTDAIMTRLIVHFDSGIDIEYENIESIEFPKRNITIHSSHFSDIFLRNLHNHLIREKKEEDLLQNQLQGRDLE